jgi:hypothetical protein
MSKKVRQRIAVLITAFLLRKEYAAKTNKLTNMSRRKKPPKESEELNIKMINITDIIASMAFSKEEGFSLMVYKIPVTIIPTSMKIKNKDPELKGKPILLTNKSSVCAKRLTICGISIFSIKPVTPTEIRAVKMIPFQLGFL